MLTSCTVRAYIYVCVYMYMYIYTHILFSWFYCSLSTVYFIVFMPSLYTKLLSTLWDEGVHSILNWKTIKSSSLEHFCNHSLILILWRTSENIPAALTINVDQTNQDNMSKQLQNIQYAWWWWWWRDMRKMKLMLVSFPSPKCNHNKLPLWGTDSFDLYFFLWFMFVFIAVQWLTRKTQYLMYEYHIQVFSLNNKDALTAVLSDFFNYYYLCVQYLYL